MNANQGNARTSVGLFLHVGGAIPDLRRRRRAALTHGLLVACPTRPQVLVHAIGTGSLTTAMRKMTSATDALHEQGPGSLTESLYWWRTET